MGEPSGERRRPKRYLARLDARAILEYLERENLFLVALDDERVWYRYHQLFADLLRARLHQAHPERIPRLHLRAAAWLEQNGFIPEAIQHLFAAHEIGRAADLIERYGPARWAESDLSVVQMADSLPREMLIARPKIGLYQAWLLINQGLIEKALPLLNDMARQLAGADPNSGQQWIQTFIGLALAFLNPSGKDSWIDPLPDDQVLDEIPADELVLRDAADILYGMTLARRGEIDRAAEFSVKCIQREKIPHGSRWLSLLWFPSWPLCTCSRVVCTQQPRCAANFWTLSRRRASGHLYCRQHGGRPGRCAVRMELPGRGRAAYPRRTSSQ